MGIFYTAGWYVLAIPHMCGHVHRFGKVHTLTCVVITTYVVISTHRTVWTLPHLCGNVHTCVVFCLVCLGPPVPPLGHGPLLPLPPVQCNLPQPRPHPLRPQQASRTPHHSIASLCLPCHSPASTCLPLHSSLSYFTSYSCFTPPSLPLSCATLHPSPPRNELAALEDTDSSTGSCSGTRVRLEEALVCGTPSSSEELAGLGKQFRGRAPSSASEGGGPDSGFTSRQTSQSDGGACFSLEDCGDEKQEGKVGEREVKQKVEVEEGSSTSSKDSGILLQPDRPGLERLVSR